ncbi:beta-lactamase/transpeptidase-like protein [Tothia fuscella]|uniref:Beta-lactamase/transpeptidase-like protein n=1 Tax=Tothia fuscella TaxID=1048955 RepID=A0A9P4TV26_9PEZI|nr:beta-lactamase/transpeptidase-like protein [Tothia fuscella]
MWIKNKSRANLKGEPRQREVPPPLTEFGRVLHQATGSDDENSLPNVAVIAIYWAVSFITMSLRLLASGTYIPADPKASSTPQPFTPDTVCRIASCTKLFTSVAALQCVERDLLTLDADISTTLPEFSNPQILVSISEENGPIFKSATRKVTLRNLLTHSSGLAYEFTHPKMFVWRKWWNKQSEENRAKSRSDDVAVAYKVPLMFEPDGGWAYGYGIDWVGVAVARVSGMSLEEYMKKNIWAPLEMDSTTFSVPEYRPDLIPRSARMTQRDQENGRLIRKKGGELDRELGRVLTPVKHSGGGGCSSTANDYIKFLSSILQNDGKLLRPETANLMFSPNLAESKHLMRVHKNPLSYGLAGNIPVGTKIDFGLGGMLNLEEIGTTGRGQGSMQWGGLPNLFWWINRKDGICGCYFGQLLPAGDVKSFEMYERYEKAVNGSFVKEKRGKL